MANHSSSNQTQDHKVDLDALERQWLRCVELVDEPGTGATGHSGAYYRAQSVAMSAAFMALPDLIAELRTSRRVVVAAREMLAEIDAGHGCDRLIQMGLRAALSEHGRE